MPISGLVITFDREIADCNQAIERLRDHPAIDVGQADANKLAIVVESSSKSQDQEIWAWLHALPSVAMVQVSFVGFDVDPQNVDPQNVDPQNVDPQNEHAQCPPPNESLVPHPREI